MRRLLLAIVAVTVCGTYSAFAQTAPPYYLALGDSFARGIQPNTSGTLVETNQGYVDYLYAFYRPRVAGLRLAKLGCSGETTTTMIGGGKCSYPLGSQLAQAVQFLQTHKVAFITLSIGGDNILRCLTASGIDELCVNAGLVALAADLPRIVAILRAAAGPNVPIVANNYYDPFLGLWIYGAAGRLLAERSLDITLFFNQILETVYRQGGVVVADVAKAFRMTVSTPVTALPVPLNVLLTLTWTWMSLPPPRGPDVHPNAVGYAVIAGAYVTAAGSR